MSPQSRKKRGRESDDVPFEDAEGVSARRRKYRSSTEPAQPSPARSPTALCALSAAGCSPEASYLLDTMRIDLETWTLDTIVTCMSDPVRALPLRAGQSISEDEHYVICAHSGGRTKIPDQAKALLDILHIQQAAMCFELQLSTEALKHALNVLRDSATSLDGALDLGVHQPMSKHLPKPLKVCLTLWAALAESRTCKDANENRQYIKRMSYLFAEIWHYRMTALDAAVSLDLPAATACHGVWAKADGKHRAGPVMCGCRYTLKQRSDIADAGEEFCNVRYPQRVAERASCMFKQRALAGLADADSTLRDEHGPNESEALRRMRAEVGPKCRYREYCPDYLPPQLQIAVRAWPYAVKLYAQLWYVVLRKQRPHDVQTNIATIQRPLIELLQPMRHLINGLRSEE